MTCEVIATGSRGNAVLLNGMYLFDCGVPYHLIEPYIKNIRVVFLTHIHGDHYKKDTIRKIHRLRPGVRFACGRNMLVPLCGDCGVDPDNVVLVTPEFPASIHFGPDSIHIQSFDLIHNVENVGYVVTVEGGEEPGTAMYATDTQYLPVSVPGLDLYMVECNYHVDELVRRRAEKIEKGLFSYEDTVAVSHMSHETVTKWLMENVGPDSQVVFLHQHRGKEAEAVG